MQTDAAMERAFAVVKNLRKEGVISDYAVGGGIAVVFYVQPLLTYDLDVFVIVPSDSDKTAVFASIFKALRKHGHKPEKEHVVIKGIPVQFLPVYSMTNW